MKTSIREELAIRFADAMSRLKLLGLKCEVAVSAGVVMVSTSDKGSAQILRASIKKASERMEAVSVETRPSKGFYVFTIAC